MSFYLNVFIKLSITRWHPQIGEPNHRSHAFDSTHLGIWRAISSRLSEGLIGVRSKRREGAKVRWPVESLTHLNTLAPLRWRCCWRCCSTRFLRLFSSARCRLCNRKKNIDILRVVVGWFCFVGGWRMLWRVDCRNNFNWLVQWFVICFWVDFPLNFAASLCTMFRLFLLREF